MKRFLDIRLLFALVMSLSFVACDAPYVESDFGIDLGLPSGTIWAAYNVGAMNPEDYGDYFAWGETTIKENYSWITYQWANGSDDVLTKYCTNSNCGIVDYKTILEIADDAAIAADIIGGDWRMPTSAEQEELIGECTWIWTTLNGVNGYRVIGTNGNSIFLPAAGSYRDKDLYRAGTYGGYWSSSLCTIYQNIQNSAYGLYFNSSEYALGHSYRNYGASIRPVRSPR